MHEKRNLNKKHIYRLLELYLYSNCFSDGDKTHLGLRFRGVYYCITHSEKNGLEIPKKFLRMKYISSKPEYLKECETIPNIVNKTNMKINEEMLIRFIKDKK